MTRLAHARYVSLIEEDGERLADAARDLHAPVPPCPGWDVREAVRHTGSVYRHKVACMQLGREPNQGEWVRAPAPHEDVVLWFRDSLALLLDEFSARRPEDVAVTWWPPEQTVAFWARRMALETAVHRADLEAASVPVTPVSRDLATDGVDEVLQIFLAHPDEPPPQGDALGPVQVSTGGHTWTADLQPGTTAVTAAPAMLPGAELSGEPSAVFLYLWGRGPLEGLSRSGKPALIDALRSRLAAATT